MAARPAVGLLGLFVVAYVAAAGFGQWLAIVPGTGITLWPPSGVFLATLILSPRAAWPWWVAAGFVAEMTCDALWFANPSLPAVAFYAGNAVEALLGATLVTRFCRGPVRLETLREVLALVVLGGAVAPVASATVGAGTLAVTGMESGFAAAWLRWWVGDATGVLIFAPLVLAVVRNWQDKAGLTRAGIVEAAALLLVLLAVGGLSLSGYLPFAYITLPPLLWAAVRFEVRGAAFVLALLALLMAAFTVSGADPFAGDPGAQAQRTLMLQLYLAMSALAALVVAALSRQHQQALARLRAANRELELRVAEGSASLGESERRLTAVLDALPIGVALVDTKGRTVVGNEVFRRFVPDMVPSRTASAAARWEGFDADGARLDRQAYPAARALRGEKVWPGVEFLFREDERAAPRWTRVAAMPFRDAAGAIAGAAIVLDDIDEEKRALDALKAGELRLRLAQESAGLGTWERSLGGGPVRCSPEFLDLHGLPAEPSALPLAELRALIHPDDRARVEAEARQSILRQGNAPFRWEYRIVRPDGQVRWHLAMGRVLRRPAAGGELLAGVVLDITERKAAEEQRLLLAREVDHRAKNALAVVQSLVRLTRADDPQVYAETLEGRIAALARAHTLLARERWTGGDLRTLLADELGAYAGGGQVRLDGPEVTLQAEGVQPLAMSMHELATNAAKYGALSRPGGTVRIAWRIEAGMLHLDWTERGGPRLAGRPERMGFGTRLLQASVRGQLGGTIAKTWEPEGLRCAIVVAPALLLRGDGDGRGGAVEPAGAVATARPGLRVLLGEDEPLVALDLAEVLRGIGCEVTAMAATVDELRAAIGAGRPDLAVLDVNLAGHSSLPDADALVAAGVPVVLVTGYGDLGDRRWPDGAGVAVLRKPVARHELAEALARLADPAAATLTER
ncbi:MAG: MASE1 domain-containing protein [Geminicoccaceae bacterium]